MWAQYRVSGQVNLGEDWQPKIFMASVNKLSDYYRTSPDMIVNTATINADGRFELVGDNLPNEQRFYRLYLMKKQNTDYDACLYVGGDDHNFVHVLLENGSEVNIQTDANSVAPFGKYTISGEPENRAMQDLARIVFPSFYFYRIKFPTELKFSEDKLHTDLKQFADTCRYPLVSLAAINNTDFDEYFDRDTDFYRKIGNRLKVEVPNSIYTKNYLLKLKYYANEDSSFPTWAKLALGLMTALIAGLFWYIFNQKKTIESLESQITTLQTPPQKPNLVHTLTQKEKEIFDLIRQGKSNKEIAAALFVELSTVKTHINKLYAKLGVKNRKEVMNIQYPISNN